MMQNAPGTGTDQRTRISRVSVPRSGDMAAGADLNMRIIQSLVSFVEDELGASRLEELSFTSGVPLDELRSCKGWISLEQAETILAFVRSLLGSNEEFMDACVYRMRESYGPLRFLLWATSPSEMLEMGQKHFSSISTFSRGDFERISDTSFRLRYYSERRESHLMCLSRQAQSRVMPTLWDLPPATLRETACICNGDPYCEYEISVYKNSRMLPLFTGSLIGAALAAGPYYAGLMPSLLDPLFWTSLPLLGGALGYTFELRRANRHNLRVAQDINEGLSRVVVENQETQHEILLLNQRQKDWNRRLEDQVSQRTAASEDLTRRLQSILEEHTTALKGVSHDMKNPLTVILQTAEIMSDDLSEKNRWMIDEQKRAVKKIRVLLDDMLQLESSDVSSMQFLPEPVETRPLIESLRRRLRALAGDTGIRISVISTRETPEAILIDRMVMDRVMDNLLSNAVKYTERGSIVLELSGKPGFLTMKISDTGRGIAREDMRRIFSPGGSDPDTRSSGSHGMGLSVVVRLLDRIGGKLEVMSLPERGTTFWVHFPVEPAGSPEDESPVAGDTDPADRVVTIRKVK